MDIQGVDRFWIKTALMRDGQVSTTLAILTRLPLHPIEEGYDGEAAARFLSDLNAFREKHGFDALEIVTNQPG